MIIRSHSFILHVDAFVPAKPGQKVVILGAGIAGLTAAYELADAGLEVVVVDRRNAVALETSAANAGTLNYKARTVVASPDTLLFAFKKLWHVVFGGKHHYQRFILSRLNSDKTIGEQEHKPGNIASDSMSSVNQDKSLEVTTVNEDSTNQSEDQHNILKNFKYFFFERQLLVSLDFWKWAGNFLLMALTRPDERRHFVDCLTEESLAVFEQTRARTRAKFDFRRAGSLYIYAEEDSFHQHAREALLAGDGAAAVTPAKAKEMEPSLSSFTFAGAIYGQFDGVGNCQQFCKAMEVYLSRKGVSFTFGHAATDVILDQNGKACAISITDQHTGSTKELSCDYVVVSCACESFIPLKTSGLSWLPIIPVRGYSLSGLANVNPNQCPSNYLLFEHPIEMAVTRLGNQIRFSSYAEITTALEPVEERMKDLITLIDQLFPEAFQDKTAVISWVGRRPMTADALPIVSVTHLPNVLLHTGHGADGWRWSHATARHLRNIMFGQKNSLSHHYLSLSRFWLL